MVNWALFIAFVTLACLVAAAWMEPTVADRVVMRLKARAAGVRAQRAAYREAYREVYLAVYAEQIDEHARQLRLSSAPAHRRDLQSRCYEC
jgi:hypothetical protein